MKSSPGISLEVHPLSQEMSEIALPTAVELEEGIKVALSEVQNVADVTLGQFRERLCQHFELPSQGLDSLQDCIKQMTIDLLQVPDGRTQILENLGPEMPSCIARVYLATISQVLGETIAGGADLRDLTQVSREDIAKCFQDAFDNPIRDGKGGRPLVRASSVVRRLVVVQEKHSSGQPHFHAVLQFYSPRRFLAAKKTLRTRHRLAVHFSCSHTQLWSALRYCIVPTLQKPVVDGAPFVWTSDFAEPMDLFELSQRPWTCEGWKKRREEMDMKASASGKRARFTKLDLTAVILSKKLQSKHEIMEYAQKWGCEAMQNFVSNKQRQLSEFLQDAWEWHGAADEAAKDRKSGWEVVASCAAQQCPLGADCSYAEAARRIFAANSQTLDRVELATCLRDILCNGPSKTTRTPLLAGATNTGKTTLVLPFDNVFGAERVLHKPAIGSKFALRNILRQKRFLLWDDYRPVEYAQNTIQVSTFLSLFTGQPFEVQVSQSFTDGNVDFHWKQGCVMTAKSEGLWRPTGCVSEEDVRHMQSRVHMFTVNAQVANLKDIEPCGVCLSKWIVAGAAARDASLVLHGPVLIPGGPEQRDILTGMEDLKRAANLDTDVMERLAAELVALGARDICEITREDWQQLRAFATLRPFEQRRLMRAI